MSERESIFSPRHCSGLMYSGVPMTEPVMVRPPVPVSSAPLAMPKSMRRTTPLASRMMFGVFRSRWMIPTSWMACRPSATWMLMSKASSVGEAALLAEHLLQVDALEELHRDVAHAAVLAVLVDAADVAVRDLPRELDLAAETLGHLPGVHELGAQDLEGDHLVEHAVLGLVDHAHAAATERAQDLVAAGDDRALRERAQGAPACEADVDGVCVLGLACGTDHHYSSVLSKRRAGSDTPPKCLWTNHFDVEV